MPELTQQEIEAVKELLSSETAKEPLSRAQKWEVAKVVSAILLGGFALLAVGGLFVVTNAAEHGAANVAAEDVAKRLAKSTAFETAVSEKLGAIPSGAVIAFDNDARCPEGWIDFVRARGRTIIGVGQGAKLTDRAFGDSGGAEEVTLSPTQMPKHAHVPGEGTNDPRYVVQLLDEDVTNFIPQLNTRPTTGRPIKWGNPRRTATAGKSEPHNNMPPYIALRFCKKLAS